MPGRSPLEGRRRLRAHGRRVGPSTASRRCSTRTIPVSARRRRIVRRCPTVTGGHSICYTPRRQSHGPSGSNERRRNIRGRCGRGAEQRANLEVLVRLPVRGDVVVELATWLVVRHPRARRIGALHDDRESRDKPERTGRHHAALPIEYGFDRVVGVPGAGDPEETRSRSTTGERGIAELAVQIVDLGDPLVHRKQRGNERSGLGAADEIEVRRQRTSTNLRLQPFKHAR